MTPRKIEILNYLDYIPAQPRKPYDDAIGYLAMWALENGNYPHVQIAVNGSGDIYASYWQHEPSGPCAYAIMGQRDQKTGDYSFHS